jgi:membrane protein DedA with SNARE-associated domain
VLFAWVFAEQVGVPVPAIPILLAMGALIGAGAYSFLDSVGLALIAALAADSVWYLLGRVKGASVLNLLCRISLEPDSCVSTTRALFTRLGGWALVVSKFVPGLSTVSTPMAGLSRMPVWKFLCADVSGILLWLGTFFGVGYVFRAQLEDVGLIAAHLGGWFVAIVSALIGGWIAWKYWQRRRFMRSLRIARISPEEVLERLHEFVILDLRSIAEVEWDGMKVSGAQWFDKVELELHHERIPRDRDIVLYCT